MTTPQPIPSQRPTDVDRTVAVVTHLASPLSMALSAGSLPFLGPLVVWLLYKDKSAFVRQSAAGAFNFAINTTILFWVGFLLTVTFIFAIVGVPMMIIAVVAQLWCSIVGAMNASKDQPYTYPMQFIKLLS